MNESSISDAPSVAASPGDAPAETDPAVAAEAGKARNGRAKPSEASKPAKPKPKSAGPKSAKPKLKLKSAGPKSKSAERESGKPSPKPASAKPARIGFGAQALKNGRTMEQLYCSDRQLPSPMDGSLAYLGVRAEPDGTSTVLFECTRSALRFELPMRNSSWRERRKVKEQVADGLEPLCPRAELGPVLQRRENYWYCPRCNIKFGLAS